MADSLVVTLTGADRPGLIGAISAVIGEHDANWEASHLAQLAGRFAGILLVTVESDQAEALTKALGELALDGVKVIVEDAEGDADEGAAYSLQLVGSDQPNIVRRISQALADKGVTCVELKSEVGDAPMAGGKIFKLRASVKAPKGMPQLALRQTLEELANSLMVDIQLDE